MRIDGLRTIPSRSGGANTPMVRQFPLMPSSTFAILEVSGRQDSRDETIRRVSAMTGIAKY
jgi:hypothetical protein